MNKLKWFLVGLGISIALHAAAKSPNNDISQIDNQNISESPALSIPDTSSPILSKVERVYNGRHYSKEEVRQLIIDNSAFYGISPDLPIRIATCESGLRWDAKNPNSSASGVFQYLSSTWSNTFEGRDGLSVFDAEANIRAAIRHISVHGTSPWNASINCWK